MKKDYKLILSLGIILLTTIFRVKKTIAAKRKQHLASKKALEKKIEIESKQTISEIIEDFQSSKIDQLPLDVHFCASHAYMSQSHNLR